MELARIDDEHNLIARYAAKLSTLNTSPTPSRLPCNNDHLDNNTESFDSSLDYKVHQNLIDELEASNRQILEEIKQLKRAKEGGGASSELKSELQMLKQHKDELEQRMSKLHDGRRDLMAQLERLMALLKTRDRHNRLGARGSVSPRLSSSSCSSPTSASLSHQQSVSSYASPSATASRTKRQFSDLFDAAEAINDALAHLVDQVNEDAPNGRPVPSPRHAAAYS